MAQYLYIWVGAYWFSATSLSKWPPGGHIGFFDFRTNFNLALNINSKLQWQSTYVYGQEPIDFQWPHFLNGCLVAILDFSVSGWHGFGSVTQVCFGISVSNFMCMSFVAVGRSLTIVSYVAFKMAALWFWTMFNCNPPIAHCNPLLWGGGILVDHWSTISSWFRWQLITCAVSSHYLNQCRFIGNRILRNKLQWHFHQNTVISLKMWPAKWQPLCFCVLNKRNFVQCLTSTEAIEVRVWLSNYIPQKSVDVIT